MYLLRSDDFPVFCSLDRGEPDGLMAQARQLTKAIVGRECSVFRCDGDPTAASGIQPEDGAAGSLRPLPAEPLTR